jgi:hypothetical protein
MDEVKVDGLLYRVSGGKSFVTAKSYDYLREAYDALAALIPAELRDKAIVDEGDVEAIVRRAGITPTIEVCEAFRLGVAQGSTKACPCGGNCACGDKFGGGA